MTEEKPANQTGDADAGGSRPLGITQEKLNELLGGVRTETRTAYEKDLAKVKAEYDEKIKIAAMKEEERAKAEKELADKKKNEELAMYKKALAMKNAEAELAKAGLSHDLAEMVVGDTDENTAKNVAVMKKQFDDLVKKQLDEKLKTGAPAKGGAAGKADGSKPDYASLRRGGWTDAQAREYLEKNK